MENEIYNSTVIGKILLTPDLIILRVRTDEPRNEFIAGQYTNLGLLAKEQRSYNSAITLERLPDSEFIKRPYSISSANVETQNFEFYITQVRSGQLTPRLFCLSQGDRLWVDTKILGVFKLNETPPDKNIVMVATGTGLAPYISFLRSHINQHKDIKLVVLHGAAFPWDLGYYSEMCLLQNMFSNFYYFPTLVKADANWNGLTGYIEKHLESGLIEEKTGVKIHPDKTHFYLCGNPKMVESVSNYLFKHKYKKRDKDLSGALHVEEY